MISDEIISYYRKGSDGLERKEFLKDHISECLVLIEDLVDSRLGRLASSKLYAHNFKELVKLAIVFHDAGKAFYQTERNIKEERDGGERYLSFMGHEFVSAYIADQFVKVKELCQTHESAQDLSSVVFAVYFHHHAIGIGKREKEAIARLGYISQAEFEIAKEKLKRVLESFLHGEDREVLRKCIDKLSKNGLSNLSLDQISNELYQPLHKSDNRLMKLSLLVLDCLLACDYISASKRDSSKSEFSQTILSFYDIWMRKWVH
ncbi:MAG: CRISPR-associated endonuclease Cas3'' [Candidatus Nitrosocaldus sp.]